MPRAKKRTKQFRYQHLLIAYICFISIVLFSLSPLLPKLTDTLQLLGLFGAFLGGMMYVSTFTFSAGVLTLLVLAPSYNIFLITAVASAGALTSDLLIFKFVSDDLDSEIRDIWNRLGGRHVMRVLHIKIFSWLLPLIGALIVASPFPDELGISLMGLSKMRASRFIPLVFFLNSIGIFLIIAFSDVVTRHLY